MTTADRSTAEESVPLEEPPASSSHRPPEFPEADHSAVLAQMATQASACTKIVAGWLVALAAFGFFGVWQTEWKLRQERPEWSRLDQEVKALRREVGWHHQQQLAQLLTHYPAAFEDVLIRFVFRREDSEDEPGAMRRVAVDLCTTLELRPELPPAVNSARLGSPKTGVAAVVGREDETIYSPEDLAQARLGARGVCKQIERKRQEIEKLDEKRRRLEASLNELPLKTPLFETKVVTFQAPLVQMILLASGIYYLDRKRREMLCAYLRAVRLANLFDKNFAGTAERIERFNSEVRKILGPAPLWLLPFPLASTLPPGLGVDDPLGHDARGRIAWVTSIVAAVAIFAYAISLFLTATGVDLALLDREVSLGSSSTINLRFGIALALVWWIGYLTITTVLPWTPPSGEAGRSKMRRRLLLGLGAGYIASLPAAAIISQGHLWVRGRIPPITWLRRVANQLLPGQPRTRTRQRWTSRWRSLSKVSEVEPGFVIREARPYPGALPKIAYVFSETLRRDKKQLFGTQRIGSAKHFSLSVNKLVSTYSEICSSSMELQTLSLTVEAAALDEISTGNIDGAFQILDVGIERFAASSANLSKALRLYDLCAAIAARHDRRDVLEKLCGKLSKHVSTNVEPSRCCLAKYIGERETMRRRRERRATPMEEANYRAAQWQERISRWSSQDSRWYKKWREGRTWKISLVESRGQLRVVQRPLDKLK